MARQFATIAIFTLGVLLNLGVLAQAINSQVSPAFALGQVTGGAIAPFLFGAIIPAIWGYVRKSEPGAFQRRTNWFALVLVLAACVGKLAQQ